MPMKVGLESKYDILHDPYVLSVILCYIFGDLNRINTFLNPMNTEFMAVFSAQKWDSQLKME